MKNALKTILICMLLLSLMFPVLAQEVPTLTQEQIDEINAALEDPEKELPVNEAYRVTVDPNDLSVAEGLGADWMNILLLGTDTGSIKLNYGRTDAMIVASVNVKTGEVKLMSLVRDMWIDDIPLLHWKNRINTANAFGGPLLAIKTVNEVLGLNIERYISVNFRGFRDVIDSLGGVTVTLSGAEAHIVGISGRDEPLHLNGEQALNYVRIRELDDNFGRNNRQRKLLNALLISAKESPVDEVLAAVTQAFRSMDTNITMPEVVKLIPVILKNKDDAAMLSLPKPGEYYGTMMDETMSVIVFDKEKTRQSAHDFIYGE
ncbi:MAG: LCP family protein [Christensenellales bacterium]|jgi:LCP family protein required for cell wall assembly